MTLLNKNQGLRNFSLFRNNEFLSLNKSRSVVDILMFSLEFFFTLDKILKGHNARGEGRRNDSIWTFPDRHKPVDSKPSESNEIPEAVPLLLFLLI
jgi:hypothetical protein